MKKLLFLWSVSQFFSFVVFAGPPPLEGNWSTIALHNNTDQYCFVTLDAAFADPWGQNPPFGLFNKNGTWVNYNVVGEGSGDQVSIFEIAPGSSVNCYDQVTDTGEGVNATFSWEVTWIGFWGNPPYGDQNAQGQGVAEIGYGSTYTCEINFGTCKTNVSFSGIYDNWTNIVLSAWDNTGSNIVTTQFEGPLNNVTWDLGEYPCDKAPYSMSISNAAPCLEPLVFDVVNSANSYRNFAIKNNCGQNSYTLSPELVAPGGTYYSSNNVACGTSGCYTLWVGALGGELQNTGIGPTGGANSTNSVLGVDASKNQSPPGSSAGGGNGGASSVTNSPGGIVNNPTSGNGDTNSAFANTNSLPNVIAPGNNYLPSVANSTNQIVYSGGGSNIADLTHGLDVLYTTDATAANQAHSDAGNAAQQAHSDASLAADQAHEDATNAVAQANSVATNSTINNYSNAVSLVNAGTADANGIINAINVASKLNHGDLGTINDSINEMADVITNIHLTVTGSTNGSSGTVTNYALETTSENLVSNLVLQGGTAIGISNTLVGLSNSLTMGTNLSGSIPSAGTNWTEAYSLASGLFGASLASLDTVLGVMSTPPDVGQDPGHIASLWELNMFGFVLDLDPVDHFPWVFTFSKGLISWVLVAGYLWSVGKLYLYVVGLIGGSQTGGVPNMQYEIAGTGGNAWGLWLGTIIPGIFVAGWVVVVTVVVVPLDAFLGIYSALAVVFAGVSSTPAGAGAMHLLQNAFPVGLLVRLVTGRLFLQFTIAKVTFLACAASRFLFGR